MPPSSRPHHSLRSRLLPALLCLLTCVLGACATSTPVLRERGTKAMQAGQYERARTHFQRIVERDATDLNAQYTLGRIALNQDRPGDARTHFSVAHTIAQRKANPTPGVDQIIDGLAEAMFQSGDHTQLAGFLQSTLERGDVGDYLRLADYYRRMGDPDNALVTYRKAIGNAPRDARPYAELSEFYDDLGDRDKALRYLRMGYQLNPQYADLTERLRSFGVTPGPTAGLEPVVPE